VTLDGIDVEGTQARLGVSFETLRRMLLRFADDGAKTAVQAQQSLAQGELRAAARHAHALAGAAGNLGADRLRALAKALEQSAGAGAPEAATHLADVQHEAARVFAAIATLAPPVVEATPSASALPAGDPAVLGAALERVRAALAEGDPVGPEEAISALAAANAPAAWRADLARLRDLADRYEFEDAAELAGQLAQRLGGPA
jgi:HPt (histidine-containing phosphotransfer) domain-containing protein